MVGWVEKIGVLWETMHKSRIAAISPTDTSFITNAHEYQYRSCPNQPLTWLSLKRTGTVGLGEEQCATSEIRVVLAALYRFSSFCFLTLSSRHVYFHGAVSHPLVAFGTALRSSTFVALGSFGYVTANEWMSEIMSPSVSTSFLPNVSKLESGGATC